MGRLLPELGSTYYYQLALRNVVIIVTIVGDKIEVDVSLVLCPDVGR